MLLSTSSTYIEAFKSLKADAIIIDEYVNVFERAVRMIRYSAAVKVEEVYLSPRTDTKAILKFSDGYEALILALHFGAMYYRWNRLVCRTPDISSAVAYAYGLRNVVYDVVGFKDLVDRIEYLVVLDLRRFSGSLVAVFKDLRKDHGIDPDAAVVLGFNGLGEGFYEALGAYVLRNLGYIVFHQGLASWALEPIAPIPGVPDIELAKGLTDRGFFIYELGIAVALGHKVRLSKNSFATGAGEVKGSRYDFSTGLNQLMRYLDSGLYDEGYLIVPEAVDRVDEVNTLGVGLITWDTYGRLYVRNPTKTFSQRFQTELLKDIILRIVRNQLTYSTDLYFEHG